MASPGFCPFCGYGRDPSYLFCLRCGKALPLPPEGATPGAPPAWGVPPPPDQPGPDDALTERPLTDAERAGLQRSPRARRGNAARSIGTFLGIIPLFLVFMAFLGTPFDETSFGAIVIVAAILSMAAGTTALRLRTPLLAALKGGTTTEVRGVPEKRPAAGPLVPVAFADLDFLMPARLAQRLPDNQLTAISFVVVGAARPPHADRARALVLGVNGDASAPEEAYLAVPPEYAQSLRAMSRPGVARKV